MRRSARTRFALLAGAVLAITTGSVAYGAGNGPLPPVPAAPPAPPASPVPQEPGDHIVIIERHGDQNGNEVVRTITKNGRTFVFRTDRVLSDDEVARQIVSAEKRLPLAPPQPPAVVNGGRRVTKQRVIVVNGEGDHVTDVVTEEDGPCRGEDAISNVDTSSEDAGKLTRVRIRMCGVSGEIGKHARAEALAGIAKARAEIAQDKDLPKTTRSQVLKELDAEVARLKQER